MLTDPSTTARQRGHQRTDRLVDAARVLMNERGTTEFTVQGYYRLGQNVDQDF